MTTYFAINIMTYPWQNALEEAKKLLNISGVEIEKEIRLDNGGIHLVLKVKEGEDPYNAWIKLETFSGWCSTKVIFSSEQPPVVIVPPPVLPPPDILYHAKATRDLLVRDARGNPVPAPMDVIRLGTTVDVYKELGRIGPNAVGTFYDDRVSITPDDLNVWKTGLQKV